MFDYYSGENIGTRLSSLSDVRTDPYNIENPLSSLQFKDVVMFPIKASIYANVARSGWHGFKYTVGLPDKFTRKSLKHQYRMSTVDGLLGDFIHGVKVTGSRFMSGEFGSRSFMEMMSDTVKGNRLPKTKKWGIIHDRKAEADFMKLSGSWEAGILDRFMVGKSGIENAILNLAESGHITPDQVNSMLKDRKFVDKVIKHKYAVHDPKLSNINPFDKKETFKSIGKYRHGFYKNHPEINKSYADIRKETASVWDLLRGKRDASTVSYFQSQPYKTRFSPVAGTFKWNKKKYARQYNTTFDAFMRAMSDSTEKMAGELYNTPAVLNAAHQAASTSMMRTKFVNMIRPTLAAAYLVPAAMDAIAWGYRKVTETMERTASTMRAVTRMEFGSENLMQSSRMASERQRAVAAIQNSHMNARYLLGNEATMYH
jgi:hypothetical protein